MTAAHQQIIATTTSAINRVSSSPFIVLHRPLFIDSSSPIAEIKEASRQIATKMDDDEIESIRSRSDYTNNDDVIEDDEDIDVEGFDDDDDDDDDVFVANHRGRLLKTSTSSEMQTTSVDDSKITEESSETAISPPANKMTERGKRFLIDCLLNLPKEEPTNENPSAMSVNGCVGNNNGAGGSSSGGGNQSSGHDNPAAFSWNGLSRPAEIRKPILVNNTWPLWIYYTRYTHRPQILAAQQAALAASKHGHGSSTGGLNKASGEQATGRLISGPRHGVKQERPSSHRNRRRRHSSSPKDGSRRVRLAFTAEQLKRLKEEFECNHYLNEPRRKAIADELSLKEAQVKVWFQNKRAQLRRICNASSFFYLQTPEHHEAAANSK